MPELAYPVGHPAHPDYKGEPWVNAAAMFDRDFPPGHGARGGANVRVLDTPDGQHAAHLKQTQDLHQLAMMGSLPPVIDPDTKEQLPLTPGQLAHIYAVRKGLIPPLAAVVNQRYGLTAEPAASGDAAQPPLTAEDLALRHIMGLGYLPERAAEILAKYGVPDIVAEQVADEHR